MDIQKYCNTTHFSSDLNFDTLIYSTIDGSIIMNDIKINTNNSNKKYIKFYPPDCCVFTTTDVNGLSVWDTEEGNVIYTYKNEDLMDHSYSKNCILSSFDEFNLKFYDLRSRYMINSKTLSNIKKISWQNENIFSLSNEKLIISDFRNLKSNLVEICNINDFATCFDRFYYISKDNNLYSCSFSFDNKIEKIKKPINFNNINSTMDNKLLYSILNNSIRLEGFNKIENINLGDIKPISFHLSKSTAYVFSESSLYKFSNTLEY